MQHKPKSMTHDVAAAAALYGRRSGVIRKAAGAKRAGANVDHRPTKPNTYGRVISNWMLGIPS